ncbi:MAG: hypothetical protein J0H01_00560 [Rhizobiales bacterium]|nr:hypothetical protein [Hyphomicrobiales bacterium]
MSLRGLLVAALIAWAPCAWGQTPPEQERPMLGPASIPEAAKFAAQRAHYVAICKRTLSWQPVAEGISRLQFASLTEEEQLEYWRLFYQIAGGAAEMWQQLGAQERARLCEETQLALFTYGDRFRRRHPELISPMVR